MSALNFAILEHLAALSQEQGGALDGAVESLRYVRMYVPAHTHTQREREGLCACACVYIGVCV